MKLKMKIEYNGDLSLYTCPTVLVTSRSKVDNVLTVSWAGIASSHPEYVTIAINTKRLSNSIIRDSMKFCINIPNSSLISQVDYCGTFSGREVDKFSACGFKKTYYNNDYIIIDQCQMHLICSVKSIICLGSHDLFVAEVNQKLIDTSISSIHDDADPIIYFRPNYYRINKEKIGEYGFTKQPFNIFFDKYTVEKMSND